MARAVTALHAGTIFLSALLLFWVELMLGKTLLPIWGGAPAVWVACMLFFQAALLAGYAWAFAGTARLGARTHAAVHVVLVVAAFAVLPLAVDAGAEWPRALPPVAGLLALLAVSVGVPFLVLATTSPLLQRWFVEARAGADPYPLYAASNLGSLVALIAYPAVLEPRIGLATQMRAWSAGYVLLAVLLVASAGVLWWKRALAGAARAEVSPADVASGASATVRRSAGAAPAGDASHRAADGGVAMASDASADVAPISRSRHLRWLALAAVPSSHMLGVTSYLTTDIAPIPLLWVLPLALYLLSFVLVFSPRNPLPHRVCVRMLPLFVSIAALLLLSESHRPLWLVLPVHLCAFFLGAMVCHGELAADRPPPRQLTEYYLWLAAGGVAGGLFNAVVAPLAFDGLVEYPLALVAACAMRHRGSEVPAFDRRRDPSYAATLGGLVLLLVLGFRLLDRAPDRASVFLLFCIPILLAYRQLRFPLRFAMSLGAIFVASSFYEGTHGTPLLKERSFFGAVRVTRDREGFHRLVHGSTVHGRQHVAGPDSREPIDYYSRTGPVGDVFAIVQADRPRGSIAGVGLGVGEIAAYALPGQRWTFYEIDPLVARIALDASLFTYLRDAFPDPSRRSLQLGDARLELASAPDGGFDLIVLDAFSSDAIPVHLVTREALALYLRKLAPDGILAFHVSNNFVELEPVLGNLAAEAGLASLARSDAQLTAEELAFGKTPSRWVAMSREESRLSPLLAKSWSATPRREDLGTWTDDHSNLLRVLRFR